MSRKIRPDLEVLPPGALYDLIAEETDERLKALASLIYLTGARISEVEEFQPRNLTMKGDIAVFKMLNLKNRAPSRRWKLIPIPVKECRCMEDKFLALLMAYISGMDVFAHPFKFWARTGFSRATKKRGVVDYSRSNLHKYLGKIELRTVAYYRSGEQRPISKPLNPHYLRHSRATHLPEYYGVGGEELMFFMGWSDIRMSGTYVHLTNLEKVFMR